MERPDSRDRGWSSGKAGSSRSDSLVLSETKDLQLF